MLTLRVVLLGSIGSGKTAFFNFITNSKELVSAGGQSVTKQIVVGYSTQGEFEIVDTPGFESESDKLLHAAGVVAALSQGDINRILILAKFERDDRMIGSIRRILSPIRRYLDNITIFVTHMDQSKNENEDKVRFSQRIKQEFNIDSVLYYSNTQSKPDYIASQVKQIIVNSKFKSIQLQDSEIFSQFDLLQLDDYNQTILEQNQITILRSFRKICRIYQLFIEQIDIDNPQLVDILHELTQDIKRVANDHVEEFEKLHGEELNEFYDVNNVNISYLHHIYLKKQIKLDLSNIIMLAQSTMTKSQSHCFNFIKLCPFCKQPWIKVVGCNGETKCGNRILPFEKDETIGQITAPKKFQFQIQDNQLKVNEVESFKKQYQTINDEMQQKSDELYQHFKQDKHFQAYLGKDFNRENFYNLMNEKLGVRFDDMILKLNNSSKGKIIECLRVYFYSLFKVQYDDENLNNRIGCGMVFNWLDQPPLSGAELKELISQDLIDFFNRDQEKLLKDETYFLEQAYKQLVKDAIQEQMNNTKFIKSEVTLSIP